MIKNFFTKKIGLKILSLVISVFLWFYVAVVLNPQTETKIRGIPIVVANFSEIQSKNLVLLNEPTLTMDLQIRGSRSSLAKTNNKNVTAVVDLAGNSTPGEHIIPVQLTFPTNDVTVVDQSVSEVALTVDLMSKKTVPLQIVVEGEPAEGFMAQKAVASIESIAIEGPATTLKLIDLAQAKVDINNADADVFSMSVISLLSSNSVLIEDQTIEMSDRRINVLVRIQPME
ncbi:MAG: hypothetical protein LBL34_05720 [Clostridiales bacterium]|nr:hypothetical protein [Clostridiales bacterium]